LEQKPATEWFGRLLQGRAICCRPLPDDKTESVTLLARCRAFVEDSQASHAG
jgi:hypothetical protein